MPRHLFEGNPVDRSVGAHLLGLSGHPLPTPARLPPETPAQTMMPSHLLASMSGTRVPHFHLNPLVTQRHAVLISPI